MTQTKTKPHLCRTVSPEELERVVVPDADTILKALDRSAELFHAAANTHRQLRERVTTDPAFANLVDRFANVVEDARNSTMPIDDDSLVMLDDGTDAHPV